MKSWKAYTGLSEHKNCTSRTRNSRSMPTKSSIIVNSRELASVNTSGLCTATLTNQCWAMAKGVACTDGEGIYVQLHLGKLAIQRGEVSSPKWTCVRHAACKLSMPKGTTTGYATNIFGEKIAFAKQPEGISANYQKGNGIK